MVKRRFEGGRHASPLSNARTVGACEIHFDGRSGGDRGSNLADDGLLIERHERHGGDERGDVESRGNRYFRSWRKRNGRRGGSRRGWRVVRRWRSRAGGE